MARKNHKYREYTFKIDAYTPETMPMARLAEYLRDLADMLGEQQNIHLDRIEGGSTAPVVRVEWEAEPKVRDRIRAIKNREAPEEAMKAARQIDHRLASDNATGTLVDPAGRKVYKFPGREMVALEFGPITQAGTLQGIPIRVGGEHDPVPVHLEDGRDKFIVLARRSIAKQIAQYIFSAVVRVDGVGRWLRHIDGTWEMLSFQAANFQLIEDADIRKNISQLREVQAEWKLMNDPLGALEQIKRGGKPQ